MSRELRYLILALTSRCNLRCSYCYHSATETGVDMEDSTIERVLVLADQMANGSPLLIQVTGGEPTLVPEKLALVARKSRLMSSPPQLALQTNGTLLDQELVDLCKRYEIQVGVSLDGPPHIQDDLRGMADANLQGLFLLEQNRVPFRITCVVSEKNVSALDKLVLVLAGYSYCRGIGLDLLVNKGRSSTTKLSPASSRQLQTGIRRMALTLIGINSKRSKPVAFREMELVQKAKSGAVGNQFCHGASGHSLAVSADGQLYPCGQTMYDPEFLLGTLAGAADVQFCDHNLRSVSLQWEDCLTCSLRACCPGDCPGRIYYGKGESRQLACVLYRCLNDLLEEGEWS